ncbi:MAG: hypothetical protein HC945_03775 [Nitrosarchaeum sp.]|nr:hypothetical protein [Nitrosarchaeum sp.]
MHRIELEILKVFKRDPGARLRTGEVVRLVLGEEYGLVQPGLYGQASAEQVRLARREKAKLHRKVLYHVGKMVRDQILSVVSVVSKGEKVFALGLEAGEYVIEKSKHRILISKPADLSLPIEGLEQSGVVARFEPDTWISRLNAMFVDARSFRGVAQLRAALHEIFQVVNDVVGINRFESVVEEVPLEEVLDLVRRLEMDGKDYGRRVCLVMSLVKVKDRARLRAFVRGFADLAAREVTVIFNVSKQSFAEGRDVLEEVIARFQERKIKINIKNSDRCQPLVLVGRAGMYSMLDADWKEYLDARSRDVKGAVLGQSSLALDLRRLAPRSADELSDAMLRCAKALLRANVLQRRNAEEYSVRLASSLWVVCGSCSGRPGSIFACGIMMRLREVTLWSGFVARSRM